MLYMYPFNSMSRNVFEPPALSFIYLSLDMMMLLITWRPGEILGVSKICLLGSGDWLRSMPP
jgi:hypothetical protein